MVVGLGCRIRSRDREQFAQMSIGQVGFKPNESSFVVISLLPPFSTTIVASTVFVSSATVVVDYSNRVISYDEPSDHGVPIIFCYDVRT